MTNTVVLFDVEVLTKSPHYHFWLIILTTKGKVSRFQGDFREMPKWLRHLRLLTSIGICGYFFPFTVKF